MITVLLVNYRPSFKLQLFVNCKNVQRLIYSLNQIAKVCRLLDTILFFKKTFIFGP